MRNRPALAALATLAAASVAACGSSSAYSCTNRTCKVTFHGTGKQDLSSALGPGGTVEFVSVDGETATVRIAGKQATLAKGAERRVGAFAVTATKVDGRDVALRVVGR